MATTTNSLTVRVAAASASGPSQFTVTVDGVQIGGVYGTSASMAAGQWDDITVTGAFAANPSSVIVTFVNDWVGGVDRTLYVDSLTVAGRTFQGENAINAAGYNNATAAELWYNGTLSFDTRPVTSSMTVRVAGNAGAQFTVLVDGQQVGGVYAAPDLATSGFADVLVAGSFATTPKSVVVNFVNDYVNNVDRTLYVDSLTLNGIKYEGENASTAVGTTTGTYAKIYSNGSLTFDTYDEIVLRVSQYAPNGGAPKFAVTVDGKQVGDVLTTSASYVSGQWDIIKVSGNFGPDPQHVGVTLLNDSVGGYDQNIWVDWVKVNGQIYQAERGTNGAGPNSATDAALWSNGTLDLALTGTISVHVSGVPTSSGPAQFTVTVDGKQIGGVQSVTASHANGEWQTITLTGSFGTDPGSVAINYLGDKTGRLYVDTMTVDGTTYNATTDGKNYAGRVVSDGQMMFNPDALTFDTDHSNQPLAAYEGAHAVAFASNAYVTAGNVLQFEKTQPWSAIAAIELQAVPQLPQLIVGNASAPSYAGYELFVNGQGHLEVRVISNIGAANYLDVTGTALVSDGSYHVVGASYDGSGKASGVKLYVDGKLDTAITIQDTLTGSAVSSGPLVVGNQLDGWQSQFYLRGALDSLALSDVERPASYFSNTTLAASTDAHTVLAYAFDAGTGTTVTDSSNGHHDGTIVGGVLWV